MHEANVTNINWRFKKMSKSYVTGFQNVTRKISNVKCHDLSQQNTTFTLFMYVVAFAQNLAFLLLLERIFSNTNISNKISESLFRLTVSTNAVWLNNRSTGALEGIAVFNFMKSFFLNCWISVQNTHVNFWIS